ncbi:MAG: protein-disulfide reductase DsbD domain-containing protein, partial [Butyricimonas faecalis]
LRHRGYPIILLGKKNPVKAIKTKSLTVTSSQEQEKDIFISGNPISVKVNHEINDDIIKVNIHFDMPPRYHLYAQSEENRFNRPIEITFDLPKGVERIGKLKCPESMSSPTGEIYKGEHLDFEQVLHIKILENQTLKIKVKVCYQTCNDDSCLQPQEEEHIIEIKL